MTTQTPYLSVGDWDSRGTDTDGTVWDISELTGWDEPPPARSEDEPRPNDDGGFDAPVFDDSRIITLTGSAVATSRELAAKAKATFGSVARMLKAGHEVIGHMVDGDYTVTGKRSGGWAVDPLAPTAFEYTLIVKCVDPYKYGAKVTVSTVLPSAGGGLEFDLFDGTGFLEFGDAGELGQVTLTNSGTADAWPTFTVTGPVLGGVTIKDTDTQSLIQFDADVPGSSVLLIIDSANGRATLNGADRTGQLSSKQWFNVPAGSSRTVQFATLGASGQAGTLAASLKPAYF